MYIVETIIKGVNEIKQKRKTSMYRTIELEELKSIILNNKIKAIPELTREEYDTDHGFIFCDGDTLKLIFEDGKTVFILAGSSSGAGVFKYILDTNH